MRYRSQDMGERNSEPWSPYSEACLRGAMDWDGMATWKRVSLSGA